MPDGAFSMFAGDERIGIGFKTTDSSCRARLFWVKPSDINRCSKRMQEQMIQAAGKFAIPPERYPEFAFLESKSRTHS
jgi:hypothetical protein